MSDFATPYSITDPIVKSDVVTAATARAVVRAEEIAAGEPVSLDHCRRAAQEAHAKVRNVAGAFGIVRCASCRKHVHVATPPAIDMGECGHTLIIEDDEHEAVLAVYATISGRCFEQSIGLRERMVNRIRKYGSQETKNLVLPVHNANAS